MALCQESEYGERVLWSWYTRQSEQVLLYSLSSLIEWSCLSERSDLHRSSCQARCLPLFHQSLREMSNLSESSVPFWTVVMRVTSCLLRKSSDKWWLYHCELSYLSESYLACCVSHCRCPGESILVFQLGPVVSGGPQ